MSRSYQKRKSNKKRSNIKSVKRLKSKTICKVLNNRSPSIYMSNTKHTKYIKLKSRVLKRQQGEFACITMKYKN
jgi:hypothetical protein